jgi:hypothetical protein
MNDERSMMLFGGYTVKTLRWLLCPCLVLLLACPASPQELGYRRITMKDRLKKFYRAGGRTHLGKKIHIYIDAKVFRKKPEVLIRPKGRVWHVFENRSVPVLVSPRNLYYKRFQRKMSLKKKKQKTKTVSVLGKVIQPSWDLKGRCYILVHQMKTYGGALKKTGD